MLWNSVKRGRATLILAHGAGAPMDSPFMEFFSDQLALQKIRVGRFEFPYMDKRRKEGGKAPPNREPVLRETWHSIIDEVGGKNLFIGGKSMGGRMASLVASEVDIRGLVCLGYPFHPPGRPDRLRTEHLALLQVPTLIVQGERDSLGNRQDVETYTLSDAIEVQWLGDGDHSFKPRKSSGRSLEDNLQQAVDHVARFIDGCRT